MKPYKSDKKAEFLKAYRQKACNITAACDAVGISRDTFYRWKKGKRFAQQLKLIEESLIDMAETQLLKNIREGNQRAVEFFLKNRAPDRWKDRTEQNLAGGLDIIVRYAEKKDTSNSESQNRKIPERDQEED